MSALGALGCDPTPKNGSPADIDALPDTLDTGAADTGADTHVDDTAPEDTAPEDTAPEDTAPADTAPEDTDDPQPPDDVALDTDTALPCPPGDACTLLGYVPPCYEGRCSAAQACVPTRIPDCCANDADCLPPLGTPACHTTRCVNRVCTMLPEPGCCTSDPTCDTGFTATTDHCLPSARCRHCPAPCDRGPILERRFDTPEPLTSLGFVVVDPQPADQVTWQRATGRSAAGAGAIYLGNTRCRTYYSGGLDAACAPTSAEQQDSQRVSPTLLSPLFSLPWDTPAIATFMLFSQVEPSLGRGENEPDVLRILVEAIGAPTWAVASTLELGKSTDWAPIVVDLAPWRGQLVRIRFEFDTLDGQNNLHEGVWLDELLVIPTCARGCCERDDDCGPTDACRVDRCLQTAQGAGKVCVETPHAPSDACTTCLADIQCDDGNPCTTDRCVGAAALPGRCEHDAFCCLAKDLLVATFDDTLHPLVSDGSGDIRWQKRDGRAWFGDPTTGTYDGPERARGSLTSPPIPLPERLDDHQTLTATFSLELSTEWDLSPPGAYENPSRLDRLVVELIDAGSALVAPLWSSDELEGTTRGDIRPITLDLMPWRGRMVSLRFTFDSGDAAANTYGGPFIDDVRVRLDCR